MKKRIIFIVAGFLLMCSFSIEKEENTKEIYNGKYCSGTGDIDFLRLIDESFAFFHPNPVVPNLTMIYNGDWDTFTEGAGWGAWWIQNSYGFSYAVTPFLQEPWFSILQRSWDLFWDNQGDGIRKGGWGDGTPNQLSELVAPDGGLGDTAAPGKIIYKQGDGDVKMHDWFYEATAACLVMQSEILLVNRDKKALEHYLPKMERACNFIERARDPKNNLFLVGPACNLLAPSYGGVKMPDGTFGKGYLAGVSITYLAALDRMVELYKLNGDTAKLTEFEHRQKITRESLSLIMAEAGYFVKSVEPNGMKHGVLGQKQFGYLEGTVNVDAVALRVTSQQTSEKIYNQIVYFPAIRPFDFLLTNAPGLDDTYPAWGRTSGKGLDGFWTFGDWVNGGVWGTVEGRAILMYYRLGKFEDVRRSANRAMKWAKDFRMDAPWSQQGENTSNPWSDKGKFRVGGVAVMVDNFAIPAATIRGLFDYDYRSDRLIVRPRIPGSITEYIQNEPVRFGDKRLFLSCKNGGPKISSVKINGKEMKVTSNEELALVYEELPNESHFEIITAGGWPNEKPTSVYPEYPVLNATYPAISTMTDTLAKPFSILLAMQKELKNIPGSEYDLAFLDEAINSFNSCQNRMELDPGPGYFRAITPERKQGINRFYEQAALTIYKGFEKRMERYSASGDKRQQQVSVLFMNFRNNQNHN